jgi:hypothetical protein
MFQNLTDAARARTPVDFVTRFSDAILRMPDGNVEVRAAVPIPIPGNNIAANAPAGDVANPEIVAPPRDHHDHDHQH